MIEMHWHLVSNGSDIPMQILKKFKALDNKSKKYEQRMVFEYTKAMV